MKKKFSRRGQSAGSALLIILGCVALLTILVTAFLITARTEFTTSNFYSKGVSTKLLSENVINLVTAQLREGARSTDFSDPPRPQAWASQPGMIRTYDNTGAAYQYFKLYSSDNMVGNDAFDATTTDIPPLTWANSPNVYTDLNEPITTANGPRYPILDPGAVGNVDGFSLDLPSGFTTTVSKLPMPVKWLYVLKDGTVTVGTQAGAGTAVTIASASVNNPVIGRIAFWTDDETSKVNINTASEGIFWDQPVANNPEELGTEGNVNGHNMYVYPYGFATAVAGSAEFQRMPGHPATTSLSTVFGSGASPVLPDTSLDGALQWPLTQGNSGTYATSFGPYYSLTPRYAAGASMGGTQAPTALAPPGYRLYDSIDELTFDPNRTTVSSAQAATPVLYPATNGISPPGRQTLPGLTPSVIDQRRFFITAHSRAPEETLFGTPRISLWPEQASYSDPTNGTIVARTAKDNLLAFCSTLNTTDGAEPYYFQRASYYQYQGATGGILNGPAVPSSQSATEDFPGPPTPASTTTPQTGVARNEDLYGYLMALTSANIPGFGGNFLAKYPGAGGVKDRDQILTEMFDLLRSGVNTINVAPGVYPNFTYTLYPLDGWGNPGCGSTVPISIPSNNTHGFGRTYNVAEAALVFMASDIDLNDGNSHSSAPKIPVTTAGQLDPSGRMSIGPGLPWAFPVDYPSGTPSSPPQFLYWDTASNGTYHTYQQGASGTLVDAQTGGLLPTTAVTIGDPQTTAIQAFLLLRVTNTLPGTLLSAPLVHIRVTNLDQLWLNGTTPLKFPSSADAVAVYNTDNNVSMYTLGGLLESCVPAGPQNGALFAYRPLGNNDGSNQNYPFVSQSVPLALPAYPGPYGGEDPMPALSSSLGSTTVPPPNPLEIHNFTNTTGGYAGSTMSINGTTLKIDVLGGISATQVLQTIYVNIPAMTLPVPTVEMAGQDEGYGCSGVYQTNGQPNGNTIGAPRIPGYGGTAKTPSQTPTPSVSTYQAPSATPPNTNPIYSFPNLAYYWQMCYDPRVIANRFVQGAYDSGPQCIIYRGDVVRSFEVNPTGSVAGDTRLLAANPIRPIPSGYNLTGPLLSPGSDDFVPLGSAQATYANLTQGPYTNLFIRQLHSLIWSGGNNLRGLLGLIQSGKILTGSPPAPIPITTLRIKNLNGSYGGNNATGMGQTNGALFMNSDGSLENSAAASAPVATPELQGAFMDTAHNIPGDWSDGLGPSGDGPFVAKPDEGAQGDITTAGGLYSENYYETNQNYNYAATTYAPNRQVPSPIIFGTLPSRVFGGLPSGGTGGVPWCTLLFCPNPSANDADAVHPGFGVGSGMPGPGDHPPYVTPPDHLWLDLFWMPVVEPFAISEPFSTAGKVNMNYEIVPFGSYIHRSTALHAVMKSTRILAIPTHANDGSLSTNLNTNYVLNVWPNVKALSYATDQGPNFSYRYGINLPATIDDFASATFTPTAGAANAFYDRFITQKDIFRSASEICNAYLVPQAVPFSSGESYFSNTGQFGVPASPALPPLPTDGSPASMNSWWKNFKLTGDNGREDPYNQIYPRLTTKSNTFEVHMRVQVLSQTPADRAAGKFDTTGGDSVVGEYRGSAIVERYLDPNQQNPPLPDFATTFPGDPTSTLDNYVHYRIVSTRTFTP
jgi:uncharacterized protein (TIGR02600 family)